MESQLDPSSLANVRCRLQRYSDAKCFTGWVVSFDESLLVIEMPTLEGLDVGERFLVQISGMDVSATLEAESKKMDGKNLAFQVRSRIHVRPPYEQARIRTDFEGVAKAQGDAFKVRVEDVSAGGMAILAQKPLDPWTSIKVAVKTAYGQAEVEGQVRYCKALENEPWRYRIGLHAPDMKQSLPLFGIQGGKATEAA